MTHNIVYTKEGESVLECITLRKHYTKEDILCMLHDIEQYDNSLDVLDVDEAWKLYDKDFGTHNHTIKSFK